MAEVTGDEKPTGAPAAVAAAPTTAAAPSWVQRLGRRAVIILIGLVVSLLAGKVVESASDPVWLEEAKLAQEEWIDVVGQTSPIGVAAIYWDEISAAMGGGQTATGERRTSAGVASPLMAFWYTAERIINSGGIVAMVQLALGALALAVINFLNSGGKSLLFNEAQANIIGIPLSVIFFASLIGGVLWVVLMGALYLLSWVTGLAVWAAGATGIVGFCWLCVTKLAEKGTEHVLTPKI